MEIRTGDVDQVIQDCLELSCIGHKNIQIDLNLGINQPVITGIESLRQVVMNLAGNAVQAIDGQEGEITVISRLDHGVISIELSDTGPGINQEHLDHIFEPFLQPKRLEKGPVLVSLYLLL